MSFVSPRLTFRSAQFTVEPGEDKATNPGVFGKSLATWIGQQVVPEFTDDSIIPEDFGWLVPVPNSDHKLYVICSSVGDSLDEWSIMVFAEGGLLSRILRRGSHTESVAALFAAIRQCIECEAGITEICEESP